MFIVFMSLIQIFKNIVSLAIRTTIWTTWHISFSSYFPWIWKKSKKHPDFFKMAMQYLSIRFVNLNKGIINIVINDIIDVSNDIIILLFQFLL